MISAAYYTADYLKARMKDWIMSDSDPLRTPLKPFNLRGFIKPSLEQ